jgi:hypothetical protein
VSICGRPPYFATVLSDVRNDDDVGESRTGFSGFDISTFECPVCDHIHQIVIDLADPMKEKYTRNLMAACRWVSGPNIGARLQGYALCRFDACHRAACCACRKLNPGILVMQSAQDWATKNVPGAIDGARDRCIFLQG